MKKRMARFFVIILVILICAEIPRKGAFSPFYPKAVYGAGYIDFENGMDGQVIRKSIPGLEFTKTDGSDWVYMDVKTGKYNAPYPDCPYGHPNPYCPYTLNGYFAAWLGTDQGDGVITLTNGATYLTVWISTSESVTVEAYDIRGTLADSVTVTPNANTGKLTQATVTNKQGFVLTKVVIHGTANQWLIDDLSTDAGGVPDTRTPIIFIPGIMGSTLSNHKGEVWPNSTILALSPFDDFLRVLRLGTDGSTPLEPNNSDYNTIIANDIVRAPSVPGYGSTDMYQALIDYLGIRGYTTSGDSPTLIVFPYDWRKSITDTVSSLQISVTHILNQSNIKKVNIIAHSQGGLVARVYIDDKERAKTVDKLITLGTPYLGAPVAFDAMHYGHECMIPFPVTIPILNRQASICLSNGGTIKEVVQNQPSAYQLLPSSNYFKVYDHGYLDINDGKSEEWFPYPKVKGLITSVHNAQLMTQAETVYSKAIPSPDFSGGRCESGMNRTESRHGIENLLE